MARNQQARAVKEADRLAKAAYVDDRIGKANDLNDELQETIEGLETVLGHTLNIDDSI